MSTKCDVIELHRVKQVWNPVTTTPEEKNYKAMKVLEFIKKERKKTRFVTGSFHWSLIS